jgi:hypothetical protein
MRVDMFMLSFVSSVIKYKTACNVISFYQYYNWDCTRIADVCITSVMYLEKCNKVWELHDLLLFITGDSVSPIAYSIQNEVP